MKDNELLRSYIEIRRVHPASLLNLRKEFATKSTCARFQYGEGPSRTPILFGRIDKKV